jgi:hypothetical protein
MIKKCDTAAASGGIGWLGLASPKGSIQRGFMAIVKRAGALPAISSEVSAALGETSKAAVTAFSTATNAGDVLAALDLAASVQGLRELLSAPEIQARIVALQDTPIGFRTDRDPKIINRKTGQPQQPYGYEVVKDAVIEAMLRGLQLVGNQFNIISGRFYCTKEGFEGLIRQLTYVTDFRPVIGVPKTQNGGAIIDCSATWQQNGKPSSLEASIPVKTSESGSADQYIGKATRKFLKRCYEVMSGNSIPEGDATEGGDSGVQLAQVVTHAPTAALPAEVAAATAPASAMSEQQQQQLITAMRRQLSPIGVNAFVADALRTYGCSKPQELPAEAHSSLMRGLSDAGNRERWNRGCGANGDQLLSDAQIAEIEAQQQAATAEQEPAAAPAAPTTPAPQRRAQPQPAAPAAAAPSTEATQPTEAAGSPLQAELV